MRLTRRWLAGGGAALAAVVALVVVLLLLHSQSPAQPPPRTTQTPATPSPTTAGQPVAVSCTGDLTTDTAALQAAITTAEGNAATVAIGAGTCALDDRLVIGAPVTVSGVSPSATTIVQHSRADIFAISGDDVTIENLHLDTRTYNATLSTSKNANPPPVLYSTGNNTTVTNVIAEAGSAFGLRITGPNPCYEHSRSGATVSNVTMTNSGTGGFASIDVDCQAHATITNVTVHGGIVSIYRDSNLTLNGLQYTPGPAAKTCAPPWFITSDVNGPSENITISNVTSTGGRGVVHGTVPNLVISNQTITNAACA